MSDLLNRIRRAQIEAGERTVMDDLRERGLLDVVMPPVPKINERTAFERWALTKGYDLERKSTGGYWDDFTITAWEAWQARAELPMQALADQAQELDMGYGPSGCSGE
jgi:hypothetical protein